MDDLQGGPFQNLKCLLVCNVTSHLEQARPLRCESDSKTDPSEWRTVVPLTLTDLRFIKPSLPPWVSERLLLQTKSHTRPFLTLWYASCLYFSLWFYGGKVLELTLGKDKTLTLYNGDHEQQ